MEQAALVSARSANRPFGRRRRNPAVMLLLILGITLAFPGIILNALCLPADGILCQGTMIGEMGRMFLLIGGAPLVAGIVLLVVLRRTAPPEPAVAPDMVAKSAAGEMAAAQATRRLMVRPEEDAHPAGPQASECPKCGGPVARGATECEWCGQPFV